MHRVQGSVGEAPHGLWMVHKIVCCSENSQGCARVEGGMVRAREVEQWCKGMHEWCHADQGGCVGHEGVHKMHY